MTEQNKLYVQYGAGNEAIPGWLNFDASPTLRIQKISILGRLLRSKLNCVFDSDIQYGDIVKGLPLKPESVDGLFCSHVLEHLSYVDCLTALKNSFAYLKWGEGYFVSWSQIWLTTSQIIDRRKHRVILIGLQRRLTSSVWARV